MSIFNTFLFDLIAEFRPMAKEDFMAYHRETMAMTMRFLRENTSMTYDSIAELFGKPNLRNSHYNQYMEYIDEDIYIQFYYKLKPLLDEMS